MGVSPVCCQVGNGEDEAAVLRMMGESYEAAGDAVQARGFYTQALALSREIGDEAQERCNRQRPTALGL